MISLALFGLTVGAQAQERWDDGMTVRAPSSAFASLNTAALLSRDQVVFGDLHAGGPVVIWDDAGISLGLVAQVQTASVFTADGRSPSRVRNAGPDIWLTFLGPKRRSAHGVVLRYRQPFSLGSSTGWFQFSPNETSHRFSLLYDGYVDAGAVHVSMEALIGLSAVSILEGSTSVTLLFPVGERAAAGAGILIGYPSLITGTLMARARPAQGVEIGAGAGFPVATLGGEVSPYPMLQLKVHR